MIDAYVWTTPNGQKLLIALEELGVAHEIHWINIMKGEQNTPEYLAINPNNKIPAIVDSDGPDGKPLAVFESGAVLTYLGDKTGKLLAKSGAQRYTQLEWMFWNVGGMGPMAGQLGYFTKYAHEKVPHAIERYTKEVNRLFKVLDTRLGEVTYLAGNEYSMADVINVTWASAASGMDGVEVGANAKRWLDAVKARPAVARALAKKP